MSEPDANHPDRVESDYYIGPERQIRWVKQFLRHEAWFADLPSGTRKAVMSKILTALAKADKPRDIGTLARALIAAERNDIWRQKLERSAPATQNTQINIDARGNDEFQRRVATMTDDELKRIVAGAGARRVDAEGQGESPHEAD